MPPKTEALIRKALVKQATADLLVRTCLKPFMKGSFLVFSCGSGSLNGKMRNTKIRLMMAIGNMNHMRTERQPPMPVMYPIIGDPTAFASVLVAATQPMAFALLSSG